MSILSRLRRVPGALSAAKPRAQPPASVKPAGRASASRGGPVHRSAGATRRAAPLPFAEPAAEHSMPRGTDIVQPPDARVLEVAIVGPPNAGKSSLLNVLIGSKVSIVSPKAQTTRSRILGAWTQDNKQVCFYDTPGIIPRYRTKSFSRELVTSAWEALMEDRLALVVFDVVKRASEAEKDLVTHLKQHKGRHWLVLNKCDLTTDQGRLLTAADYYKAMHPFEQVFFTSAATGAGLPKLKQALLDETRPGPWQLAAGVATDQPNVEIVTETVREQLFRRLDREVPYQLDVDVVSWFQSRTGAWLITVKVAVVTKGQVAMVLGRGGSVIKAIRDSATERLIAHFKRPVTLELVVKLEKMQ